MFRSVKPEPAAGNTEVQYLPAIFANGVFYALPRPFFNEDDDATAAAGAAYFRGSRSLFAGGRNQFVDERRGDTGRIGAAQLPLLIQRRSTSVHLAFLSAYCISRAMREISAKVTNDVLVAIDVLLEYLPIVDARLARRAGIDQHKRVCSTSSAGDIAMGSQWIPSGSRWMVFTPPYIAG